MQNASAGCAVVPAIDKLSPAAQRELLSALSSSGILKALGLATGTDLEKKVALNAGLEALSKCDERIKQLIPAFNSMLSPGSPISMQGGAPSQNQTSSTPPEQPVAKPPEPKIAPRESERFQSFLKRFAETFDIRDVSNLSDREAAAIGAIAESPALVAKIFAEPFKAEAQRLAMILSALPSGSPVETALAAIDVGKITTLKFLVTDTEFVSDGRNTLSALVNLVVTLGLFGIKAADIPALFQSRGHDVANLRELFEMSAHLRNVGDFLKHANKDSPKTDLQLFDQAVYATRTFATNADQILLRAPDAAPDYLSVMDLFSTLGLNPVRVLGVPGPDRSAASPPTAMESSFVAHREEYLRKANAIRAEAAKIFEQSSGGKAADPEPDQAITEDPSIRNSLLTPSERVEVAAAAEASAAARMNDEILGTSSLWDGMLGRSVAPPKNADLLFDPLPLPLAEMTRLPGWGEFLRDAAQDPSLEQLNPERRDRRAFIRLAGAYGLHAVANWQSMEEPARQQVQRFYADTRFASALSEPERAELGYYSLLQQIDRKFYPYAISRGGADFALPWDESTPRQFASSREELRTITGTLQSSWNVKASTPESAIQILTNGDLKNFFTSLENAGSYAALVGAIGLRASSSDRRLVIEDPAAFKAANDGIDDVRRDLDPLKRALGDRELERIVTRENVLFQQTAFVLSDPQFLKSYTQYSSMIVRFLGLESSPDANEKVFRFVARTLNAQERTSFPVSLTDPKLSALIDFYCVQPHSADREARLSTLLRLNPERVESAYQAHQTQLREGKTDAVHGLASILR